MVEENQSVKMSKTYKIDLSGVKKLEGAKNFPLWKLSLENVLWAAGVQNVAFGKMARPASDADLQKQWDMDNRAAMGIILQTLDEKLTCYILTCTTSNEMWKKLDQTFGKSNEYTQQLLLEEFYQSSLIDKTPTELVNQLQTIGGQLSAIGYNNVDDAAIMGKVLHEMKGPKYDSFVESWGVVPKKEKTITNLVQKLNVNEARHETWDKTEELVAEKAFSGVKPGGAKFSQSKKQLKSANPVNGIGKKDKKCFNCGEKGHFKADCTAPLKKKQESSEGRVKTPKGETEKKPQVEKAFMMKGLTTKVQATRENFVWYCDSGTNVHVTGRRDWFTSYKKFDVPRKLQVATNWVADCPGMGVVTVHAYILNKWEVVDLVDVLYLPGGANLFSQGVMWKKGFSSQSSNEGTIFYTTDGRESLQAKVGEDGMLVMLFKPVDKLSKAFLTKDRRLQQRWHERLGHVCFKYLQNSVRKQEDNDQAVYLGPKDEIEQEYKCGVCVKAKSTLKPYHTQRERHYETGELLHTDLIHAVTKSNQGNKYFLLIKDHESNYRIAYFQKTKEAEVTVPNLMDAINMISNQTGRGVKRLKSDRGTEYTNSTLEKFLSGKGIIHELTPAGCSASNGKIERDVRTVRNMARALLLETGLSSVFWQDAVALAVYTLNRLLSSTNKEKTPYEMLFKRKPNLAHARIFGCSGSARILNPNGAWTTRTREGLFVGHEPDTKEYKLWDCTKREYFKSRHVDFFEDLIPFNPSPQGTVNLVWEEENSVPEKVDLRAKLQESRMKKMQHSVIVESDEDVLVITPEETLEELDFSEANESLSWADEDEDDELENTVIENTAEPDVRRSQRENRGKPPDRLGMANAVLDIQQKLDELTFQDRQPIEPQSYREAMSGWDRLDWIAAMENEMNSQLANGTWELIKKPLGKKVLRNMWVFKLKRLPEGGVKYKARLVVKGCGQKYGVDFQQTFAPVIRYETVRTLIAVAAARKYHFVQFDISTAFLNTTLDKNSEVFMVQPEGYQVNGDFVCKLRKGMYGLKDSPWRWHKELKQKLIEMGFVQSLYDPCLFMLQTEDGCIVFIGIYVDDGLCVGNNSELLDEILDCLAESFKMTITKDVKKFLGLEITISEVTVQIHQESYIMDIAKRIGLDHCKRVDIPMSPSHDLEPDTKINRHDPTLQYQELVGALLFVSRCTRPDISFAVGKLSRYFQCYESKHMNAAKQVLRYLVSTSTHGISYVRGIDLSLTGYSDADYAGCKQQLRSTSGVLFMINESPLTWISKRQALVAQSSTESEYVALGTTCKEGIWLRNLLCEMRALEWNHPFTIYTDSQSAMKLADNETVHERTKHIAVRWHFLRWMIDSSQLDLQHKPTNELVADALTKALPRVQFLEKRDRMNLVMKAAEPEKRKALMSMVVPTKRFKLNLTSLLLCMCCILSGVGFGDGEQLKDGSAVVWRRDALPAVVGFNRVNMRVNLVSPCRLLPLDGFPLSEVIKMKSNCQNQYEPLFRWEIEKMCPKKVLVNKKSKKAVPLVIGMIFLFAWASAGVGMAGYTIHKTDQLEVGQKEIERTLDDIQMKAIILSQGEHFLQEEVKKLGKTVNDLIEDVNLFKEKFISVQFIVSYIMSKIFVGREVMMETKRLWSMNKMNANFFDFLNITLPCGLDCPMELGYFKSCHLEDENSMHIEFTLPIINRNLTVVKADPFFLMVRRTDRQTEKSTTCQATYHGPRNALISLGEDCLYAVDIDTDYWEKRLSNPFSGCMNQTLSEKEAVYRVDKCVESKEGEEVDFIQVKIYHNMYHIYCPNSVLFFGENGRKMNCSNKVFTLPLTATFTLNHITYKGHELNLVFNENDDPLLEEKMHWHLTPTVNWDEMNRTLPIFTAWDPNHWNRDFDVDFWIIVAAIVGGLILVIITTVCCTLKCKRGPKNRSRAAKTTDMLEMMDTPRMKNARISDSSVDITG